MFLRKHLKKKKEKKRTLTFQQNIHWHANSLSPYLFFTSPSTSLTEMQLCSQLSKLLTSSEHANVILISLYLRFECSCRIYWRNLENLNTLNNKASCIIWLSHCRAVCPGLQSTKYAHPSLSHRFSNRLNLPAYASSPLFHFLLGNW